MERLTHSQELKRHTRDVHIQLEQMLIPLIQSVSTRTQYAELLKIFYTFYAPLEQQLSGVSGIGKLTADIQLRKADSLKKDITALKATTDSLSLCNELPGCTNLSHAFGIMYVLEGSVLGGKAIANIVTKKLPADTSLPFSFFLHYGDEAKSVWDQFKVKLDSTENLSTPALLSAATDTFILFKQWIDKNSSVLSVSPEKRGSADHG